MKKDSNENNFQEYIHNLGIQMNNSVQFRDEILKCSLDHGENFSPKNGSVPKNVTSCSPPQNFNRKSRKQPSVIAKRHKRGTKSPIKSKQ